MEIFVVRWKESWESYKNARALGKAKRRFQLFAPLVTLCAAKNAAKKRLVTKGVLSVNTWLFGVFVYQYTIYTVWLSS